MAIDADTVVIVGAADIARIVKRTRARISKILQEQDRSEPLLPDRNGVINGYPFWWLGSLLPSLDSAGYAIDAAAVDQLRSKQAVPLGTVPVGGAEAAEVLGGISQSTLRSRTQSRAIAEPLFVMSRNNVWDMDELIVDARSRNFAVDEAAAAKWRDHNGLAASGRREVEIIVRIRASVPALNDEAGVRRVEGHLRSLLLPGHAAGADRIRVLEVEAQPATQ